MKRLISLVLCLALIVSVCAIPAQASGIGTGILIAASAASVISAALIGLGILPGSDGSVFDGIVSGAADYLSSIGFGDGVTIPILKYVGSGGAIQYALQSAALVALRSWLFSEDVVSYNSSSTSGSFTFDYNTFNYTASVPVFPIIFKYTDPSKISGKYYHIYLFSDTSGSGTYTTKYLTSPQSLKFYSSSYSYGYYAKIYSLNTRSDYFSASIPFVDCGEISGSPPNYPPSIDWRSFVGSTSSYDISLGDVASEDVELPVGYPNWAIDSVQVPGGGGDEDPIPYVPIGIGESLEGTKTLTQTEVQSGQSTLVTDDEGTEVEVEGEVGGSISSGGSGGGDLPSGTEGPTVDDLVTMFAWLAVRIDEAVATIFPDLQVIKTYLRTIATWHETENVKYDSMLSYFMGWESDFDSMMNSLSSVDLKLSSLVADSSVIKSTLATINSNLQDIRDVIADPLDADINESQQDNKQSFLSNFGNKGQSDNIGSLGGISDGFTEWFALDADPGSMFEQMESGWADWFSSGTAQSISVGGGASAAGISLMGEDEYVAPETPYLDAWDQEVQDILNGGGSDG